MKRRRTFIRLAYHSKHNTTTSCVYVLIIVLWNGYNLMRATRLTCLKVFLVSFFFFLVFKFSWRTPTTNTNEEAVGKKKEKKARENKKKLMRWDNLMTTWIEIIWPNWIKSDNISLSVSLLKHFIVHIILILLLKNFNRRRRRRRRKNKRERKREKEVFIGVLVFHIVV